jgi:hypothetical protein
MGRTGLRGSIGPDRIEGGLGHGGIGVVYRVEHRETARPAAVKTALLPRRSLLHGIRRRWMRRDEIDGTGCHVSAPATPPPGTGGRCTSLWTAPAGLR